MMYIPKRKILPQVTLLALIDFVQSECVLSLKDDFPAPQPVYIQGNKFLAPKATNGGIYIQNKAIITASCSGANNFILLNNETTGVNVMDFECLNDYTFSSDNWTGEFQSIRCKRSPWFKLDKTKIPCHGNNTIVRVGYEVKRKLHVLYEACFNKRLLSTVYVKYHLSPSNLYIQTGRRPNFDEGDLFGKIRMNKVYGITNQKQRFIDVLGEHADIKYLSKSDSLSRGHLAARADFSLKPEQRASFQMVNVAPQWRKSNQGDWAALETAVRRRVHKYGKQITVYTGTYGVTTLKNSNGIAKELYLYADENGNDIVPVPMYFYKVLYDPQRKLAAAFVTINNPYYSETETKKLTFCTDICEDNPSYGWLQWRERDGTKSFCCDFDEFRKTVTHLPNLRANGGVFS